MKYPKVILLFVIFTVVSGVLPARRSDRFAIADDMPRGALVYAEASDLPSLIERWQGSKLKEKYLGSRNFDDLGRRHLGLKLASRWQEFSDGIGMPIDLSVISGLAEKRAAIALYDIGKLEFVMIAPLAKEAFETARILGGGKFESRELANGTVVYRTGIDADRGRQKQDLLIAHRGGSLVLATSEILINRTLSNIDGNKLKDRLSDDASFAKLARRSPAGDITVWADQKALRDDYYFKRYWLLDDTGHNDKVRAGLFAFALEENSFVERRIFLEETAANSETNVSTSLFRFVIPSSQFHHAAQANAQTAAANLSRIVRFGKDEKAKVKKERIDLSPSFTGWDHRYYPDSEFNERIDVSTEYEDVSVRSVELTELQSVLNAAAPDSLLSLARAAVLPEPFFAGFGRASVIHLRDPAGLDRTRFEAAIVNVFAQDAMMQNADLDLVWKDSDSCGNVRTARLPMIDWEAAYSVAGDHLLVSNNEKMICESLAAAEDSSTLGPANPLIEQTVIDIGQAAGPYKQIFERLKESGDAGDLFTGNIAGLIDVVGAVRISLEKSRSDGLINEELGIMIAATP